MSIAPVTDYAADDASSGTLEVVHAITTAVAASLAPVHVDNAVFATLPAGYTSKELTDAIEKARPTPSRKRGTLALGDVPSLLAYCADQAAQAQGYVYADPDGRTITAVFDDQRSGTGWREHRATFRAEFTPEFKKWLDNSKKSMTQTEFAEFIEDNVPDLNGSDATLLLEVTTTIQATTGIDFSSAKRLQDGQTQLTYTENIDAKAGASGALKIPQTFALGLRIFKNGEGYKLTARLKYRLAGGGVKFWYELERPEKAVDDAFTGYVTQVREASGYTVLVGKA